MPFFPPLLPLPTAGLFSQLLATILLFPLVLSLPLPASSSLFLSFLPMEPKLFFLLLFLVGLLLLLPVLSDSLSPHVSFLPYLLPHKRECEREGASSALTYVCAVPTYNISQSPPPLFFANFPFCVPYPPLSLLRSPYTTHQPTTHPYTQMEISFPLPSHFVSHTESLTHSLLFFFEQVVQVTLAFIAITRFARQHFDARHQRSLQGKSRHVTSLLRKLNKQAKLERSFVCTVLCWFLPYGVSHIDRIVPIGLVIRLHHVLIHCSHILGGTAFRQI